jgi:hypothetical protein
VVFLLEYKGKPYKMIGTDEKIVTAGFAGSTDIVCFEQKIALEVIQQCVYLNRKVKSNIVFHCLYISLTEFMARSPHKW